MGATESSGLAAASRAAVATPLPQATTTSRPLRQAATSRPINFATPRADCETSFSAATSESRCKASKTPVGVPGGSARRERRP